MEKFFFEVADGGVNVAVVNNGGAMAGDSISKHRRSTTSQKGRGKIKFGISLFIIAFFALSSGKAYKENEPIQTTSIRGTVTMYEGWVQDFPMAFSWIEDENPELFNNKIRGKKVDEFTKIRLFIEDDSEQRYVETSLGTFSNNTFVVQLLNNVPAGLLKPISDRYDNDLNVSDRNAKYVYGEIRGESHIEGIFHFSWYRTQFHYLCKDETDESGYTNLWDTELVYVDRDVNVTGKTTWQEYNLSLKKGWNWVYISGDESVVTTTVPSGAKFIWTYFVYDVGA